MQTLSIKETLKLLAPDSNIAEFKDPKKTKKKQEIPKLSSSKKKSPRSPVKLPAISPAKNIETEKIEVINGIESMYEQKKEDKEVAPHTPTRIKLASPRTPLKKFSNLPKEISNYSLKDKLHEYRYTVVKYILDERDNNFVFVACFNPNGQLIFIDIKDMQEHISVPESEIIVVNSNFEDIIYDSFQGDMVSKMPTEIVGLVFYDGLSYLSCIRKNDGSVQSQRYDICNIKKEPQKETFGISHTFMIIRLNELLRNANFLLDSAKKTYQIIQQQQLLITKNIIENITASINNLGKSIQNFNYIFQQYAKHIADDWTVLGSYAAIFYHHYGEQKLDEVQKETFDKISGNMFARFQNFNQQLNTTNYLSDIIPDIDRCSKTISQLGDELETNDIKYNDKILDLEELDIIV